MTNWLERQRNILDFTLSSLLRRKWKNLALASVYTLIVFLLASVMFFTYAIRREASLLLDNAPEMTVQRLLAGRHSPIPLSYLERIKDIPGVHSARGRLWGYYFDPVVGANYTLVVPEAGAPEKGTIRVGAGVARARSLLAGDMIEFKTASGDILELEAREFFPDGSELVSSDLIVLSADDFLTISGGTADAATDLAVGVRNPRELATIAGKIAERLPDTRVILREEILRTYDAVFNWRGGLLVIILGGAMLAFIILAWEKASGLGPEERREIGILKAIGWETSDVLLMKFWEGMTVSLSSFFLGLVLAYLHVFTAGSGLFAPVLKGWSVLLPEFRLVPYIDGAQIAALFFLTVVPYSIATIIPAWRASIVDPDSVMR
jgi:ABC-type lipoprotein release transport system permease subunit